MASGTEVASSALKKQVYPTSSIPAWDVDRSSFDHCSILKESLKESERGIDREREREREKRGNGERKKQDLKKWTAKFCLPDRGRCYVRSGDNND